MSAGSDSVTWQEFSAGVNPRFLLPVRAFQISIGYLPLMSSQLTREVLMNKLLSAAAAVVEPHPSCELRSLRVEMQDPASGSDDWGILALDVPIYGFVATIRRDRLVIFKSRSQIRDLIDGMQVVTDLLWRLFPVDRTGTVIESEDSLLAVGVRPVRCTTTIDQGVNLGSRIGNEADDVRNQEIFARLAHMDAPATANAGALTSLQIDHFLRGDLKLGFNKELNNRQWQCWITVEAPWNVSARDVDLKTEIASGDKDAPLELVDLSNTRSALVLFYRDLILSRFMPQLFGDVNLLPSVT